MNQLQNTYAAYRTGHVAQRMSLCVFVAVVADVVIAVLMHAVNMFVVHAAVCAVVPIAVCIRATMEGSTTRKEGRKVRVFFAVQKVAANARVVRPFWW